MIENDPTLPEAELLEVLTARNVNPKFWTASDNKKFLEAYELYGWDISAITKHVETKSNEQITNKRHSLLANM